MVRRENKAKAILISHFINIDCHPARPVNLSTDRPHLGFRSETLGKITIFKEAD